ncbi:MAG: hypothetical protein JNK61_06650 [Bacteroidia bacterium]|nr:hypothetical protein [Bacteroidia bacterium]HQU99591.1 hypothetical protein [Bacteroidia bacterium]
MQNPFIRFILTTIKGGVFLLLPVFAIIYGVLKVADTIRPITEPIILYFGFELTFGPFTQQIFALLILFLLCFIAGLLLHLKFFKTLNIKIDSFINQLIPSYGAMKSKVDNELKRFNSDDNKNANQT